jgi:hypothetical protein
VRRRELLLGAFLGPALDAATDDEIRDVLALIASALAEANPAGLFEQFDPGMPELPTLRSHLEALMTHANVLSSIELVEGAGDGGNYTADLDWILEIRPKPETGPLERRRERIKCAFRKQKRRWRVVSLAPVSFFAPSTRR